MVGEWDVYIQYHGGVAVSGDNKDYSCSRTEAHKITGEEEFKEPRS